jgi:putative transposase
MGASRPCGGTREVLTFITGDYENERAWTDLLNDLQQRGLQSVGLWRSTDGNQAMLNALAAKFSATPRQRSVKHKLENVVSYIPKARHDQVAPELKAIFYQTSRKKPIRPGRRSARNMKRSTPRQLNA